MYTTSVLRSSSTTMRLSINARRSRYISWYDLPVPALPSSAARSMDLVSQSWV